MFQGGNVKKTKTDFARICLKHVLLGPKQAMTENKLPVFEPDFCPPKLLSCVVGSFANLKVSLRLLNRTSGFFECKGHTHKEHTHKEHRENVLKVMNFRVFSVYFQGVSEHFQGVFPYALSGHMRLAPLKLQELLRNSTQN